MRRRRFYFLCAIVNAHIRWEPFLPIFYRVYKLANFGAAGLARVRVSNSLEPMRVGYSLGVGTGAAGLGRFGSCRLARVRLGADREA